MSELLLIALAGAVFWFWRDSMISRESATTTAQRACQQINAQLLDQTVVLRKLRLCRSAAGNVAVCRTYSFDFSVDGERRLLGCVALRGQRLEEIVLDLQNDT